MYERNVWVGSKKPMDGIREPSTLDNDQVIRIIEENHEFKTSQDIETGV